MRLTIDFETRSRQNIKVGSWRYASDPSTAVMCLAYKLDDGETKVWVPDWIAEEYDITRDVMISCVDEHGEEIATKLVSDPSELYGYIVAGAEVEAHNAFFERSVWRNIMVPRHGAPDIPDQHWRCSAAKCAAHALPRSLGGAAIALQLDVQKDTEGKKMIQRLCKPKRPSKADPREYWGSSEEMERFFLYCARDVETEHAVSGKLPEFSEFEQGIWFIDQNINEVGIPHDHELVDKIMGMIAEIKYELGLQTYDLTDGAVLKPTSRIPLLNWLEEQDYPLPNTQGETIDRCFEDPDIPDHVYRVLKNVRQCGRSSTAKFIKMQDCADPRDQRIRDTLMFWGANTGRWCLTGDHEVLTPTGWVRFDKWPGGEIACWNPNEQVTFADSKALKFGYNGPMMLLENKRFSQLSTTDHSMPFWDRKGDFGVRKISQLPTRPKLPYTGVRKGPSGEDFALRLLVATQADGHYDKSGVLKFHFSKKRKIERLRHLLRRENVVYSEKPNSDGTHTFKISRRHLPKYLQMFSDKTFGPWLFEQNADVFFDELPKWDGSWSGPNSIQYSTTNELNMDFVQAFAHMSGRACSVRKKYEGHEKWNTSYVMSIWVNASNRHELREQPKHSNWFAGKVYCAETPTGFFLVRRNGKVWVTGNSGKGVQFQNLPRGVVKDMEAACELIRQNDLDGIKRALQIENELIELVGKKGTDYISDKTDPMEFFSSVIRGMLKASEGHELVVADYASIEARGVTWAARDEGALKVFWAGEDIYCDMATTIYGRKITKANAKERQLGKQAILGLGYGMGAKKFLETCRKYNIIFDLNEMMALISRERQEEIEKKIRRNPLIYFDRAKIVEEDIPHLIISKFIVENYREKYSRIVEFWAEVEAAAVRAVREYESGQEKRRWIKAHPVMFKVVGSFLFCRLPSGRRLAYPYPYMKEKKTLWGEMKDTIHFMGVDSMSKKWVKQTTYGGKLVENIIQAISRDVMANAMATIKRVAPEEFKIILTVHDELVTERDLSFENEDPVGQLEALMSEVPEWAEGFPVAAEGWRGQRYRK